MLPHIYIYIYIYFYARYMKVNATYYSIFFISYENKILFPNNTFSGYRGSFLGHEVKHSLSFSAVVKNERIYTSSPPAYLHGV
jgi:hypothetical protein